MAGDLMGVNDVGVARVERRWRCSQLAALVRRLLMRIAPSAVSFLSGLRVRWMMSRAGITGAGLP